MVIKRDTNRTYQGRTFIPGIDNRGSSSNSPGGLLDLINQIAAKAQNDINSAPPFNQGPPNYPTSRHYAEYDTPKPRVDPMQQIMAQLQSLLSNDNQPDMPKFDPISLPSFDPNRFKRQAEDTVNAQFNPILQDIRSQQGATQSRATSNQRSVGQQYGALAGSFNKDLAASNTSYDAAQGQSKKLYDDERNRIAAGYAADAAAQRDQARKLGTEALGVNEAIAQQNSDKQFADSMNSQQMQSTQGAMEMQQQGAADYDRAMAAATRAEGAEVQGDIGRQLEDYMRQSNSDYAGVQSQAAGSVQDLMMKLADATYQRDASNAQFGYQQQRDYISDANNLADRGMDTKLKQLQLAQGLMQLQGMGQEDQSQEKLNSWQQAAMFADQLRPGQGSDIVAAIQGAMNERPEIYARSKEDPVPMNPALFAKLIADSQSAQGMDRNSVMQVANELYKMLYGVG